MYSWFLVLVFLIAESGQGGKRRHSSAQQPVEQPEEDVRSEYNPGDDSAPESQEEDCEAIVAEVRSKKKESDRGKGKLKEKEKGKSKEKVQETGQAGKHVTYVRGGKRTGGIEIREHGVTSPPRAPEVPVDPRRRSMYASKNCIEEPAVGIANLFDKVLDFQALFENGNLHEICNFPKHTGYGLELVREFYMRARHLVETDGSPYVFTTLVRGVEITVTLETIGSVFEMPARTDGVDYLNAGLDSVSD